MCGLRVSSVQLRQKDHMCGIHDRVLHKAKELRNTDSSLGKASSWHKNSALRCEGKPAGLSRLG